MNGHHYHAVIWVDHREARIFHLSPTDVDRLVLYPDHPTKHIHNKANSIGSGHAQEDQNYFQAFGIWCCSDHRSRQRQDRVDQAHPPAWPTNNEDSGGNRNGRSS